MAECESNPNGKRIDTCNIRSSVNPKLEFVGEPEVGNSWDGDADEAWPASPLFQQLSLERINDSPVILGVGVAGTGNWTSEHQPRSGSEHPNTFQFDLACRCPHPPTFQGRKYQLSDKLKMQALREQVRFPSEGTTATATIPVQASSTYQWSYRVQLAS
ncbi:hypothetical protein OAM37_00095 [bacterium]|nr:hypothetical protein [bacterium]